MALERKRIGGGKPGTPEQVSRSGLAAGKLQPLGGRGGCTVSTPASTLGKSQPRSGRKSPVGAESVLGAGERRNAGEQLSAIEPDGTPSLGASPGAVRQLQPLDVRSDEAPMGAVLRRNAISSLPSLTCPGAQHASSRSLAPMRVEEEIEAVVEPVEGTSLTDRDRKRAAACLKRSKLISDLSSVNLYEVSKLLRTVDFEAGMKVVTYGDIGDCCYVIDAGELDVYVAEEGDTTLKPVSSLGAGELFGELGAFYSCRRTATVVSRTLVRLWKLRHADFTRILKMDAVTSRREVFEILRAAESLQALDERAISLLADVCEQVWFEANETIISQGHEGDALYIVKSGSVIVTQSKPIGGIGGGHGIGAPNGLAGGGGAVVSGFAPPPRHRSTFCRMIGPGGYFGERALLVNEPRSATVVAAQETECLVVRRESFQQLLGPLHSHLKAHMPHDEASRDAPADALSPTPAAQPLGGSVSLNAPRYNELKVLRPLGVGALSAVALVSHAPSRRLYALKIVHKAVLTREADIEQLRGEKQALQLAGVHPCIAQLHGTYQDVRSFYLLLEPCLGGNLFDLMRDNGALSSNQARFYAATCALALERLHRVAVAYRDLKPENVMIDAQGFARLSDFGLARQLRGGERAYSASGTLEYMAPEMLRRTGHAFAVDFWALGVLTFEMLVGRTPFVSRNGSSSMTEEAFAMELMSNILAGKVHWPAANEPQVGRDARDFISQLLRVNVAERMGNLEGGIGEVLDHSWFTGLDLSAITMRSAQPPYRPELSSSMDTSAFTVDPASFAAKLQGDKSGKQLQPFAVIEDW